MLNGWHWFTNEMRRYHMSGRKSTEVNSLLARGKNARESGAENFKGRMGLAKKNLQANQKELDRIYKIIDEQNINIRPESKKEFPQESKIIQQQFDNIKKSNIRIDYCKEIEEAEREEKVIDADLKNADREQESIRKRIQNKDWYCDEEYKDAGKLVGLYQKISEKKNKLLSRFTKKAQESNQTVIKYQTMEKQINQIADAERELNEKALKIVQLREKANDSKRYIQKEFESINRDLAIKFLPKETELLESDINNFMKMDDEQVVECVTNISERISIFAVKVDEKYSEYLARIEKIESQIAANRESLKSDRNFYFEPVDYFKNKDRSTKIAVLDYLSEYSDKNELVDQILNGIKMAQALLDDEKFDEAESQTQKNDELIEQANQYATLLQEHMIENFYVAKDMTKVMKEMGFETGAYKIDGHIKNGWKISASNPNGEKIDFTKVFMDDTGKMNIEIDHKSMGDCPSKWSDICRKFEEMGILIEKVTMENGLDVYNKREKIRGNEQDSAQGGVGEGQRLN